jgi:4-hydroxybenzoate polyprenyltransferase
VTTHAGAPSRVASYLSLVKFSHSVFALPFALLALLVATGGRPPLRLLLIVVAAVASARTAAMAFNRIVDARLDAQNPRTRGREIPAGRVGIAGAAVLAAVSAACFVGLAGLLNPLCLLLSPLVLAVLLGYSFGKRFTSLAHLWLGAALALAPLGAWLAATGSLADRAGVPLTLAAAVLTWVAGFDLIYACQDCEFDRAAGLHSIPARLGKAAALHISSALHAGTVVALLGFGALAGLSVVWHLGVAATAVMLWHEHRIVSPADLSRVNAAFFTLNGAVSLVLCTAGALDLWVR